MGYEKWLKGIIGEAIMDCRLRGLWCDLLKKDCQHATPYHVLPIIGFVLYWCHVYSACFHTFINTTTTTTTLQVQLCKAQILVHCGIIENGVRVGNKRRCDDSLEAKREASIRCKDWQWRRAGISGKDMQLSALYLQPDGNKICKWIHRL